MEEGRLGEKEGRKKMKVPIYTAGNLQIKI